MNKSGLTIVFIDEYNLSTQILRPYSWISKGKEDFIICDNRGKTIHVIVAATYQGIIAYDIQDSTVK
jgi:hypothetical protein